MDASPHLTHTMIAQGHVATRTTLLRLGVTPAEIASGMASGYLKRPLRGWYVSAEADSDQRRAVIAGTRIGCVSALRRWGLWDGDGNTLHLHAAPTASRLRLVTASARRGSRPAHPHPRLPRRRFIELDDIRVCDPGIPMVHWRERQWEVSELDWIVSPADALAEAIRCVTVEQAIACIDSALHHGAVTAEQWASIRDSLPARLHHLDGNVDARAGSGLESIARVRLVLRGHRVQPQFQIPGVGHLDMLVDDLVGFETDGDRFHSTRGQRATDRTRLLLTASYGVPTIRIGSEHYATEEWPLVLSALDRQLADARALARLQRRLQR